MKEYKKELFPYLKGERKKKGVTQYQFKKVRGTKNLKLIVNVESPFNDCKISSLLSYLNLIGTNNEERMGVFKIINKY